MALFLMSSYSFAQYPNCAFWGYMQATEEENTYGEMGLQDFADAHNWYQSQCEAAGGSQNISDPVFL